MHRVEEACESWRLTETQQQQLRQTTVSRPCRCGYVSTWPAPVVWWRVSAATYPVLSLVVTASFQSQSPAYSVNGCSAPQWLHGWHHRLALPRLFTRPLLSLSWCFERSGMREHMLRAYRAYRMPCLYQVSCASNRR